MRLCVWPPITVILLSSVLAVAAGATGEATPPRGEDGAPRLVENALNGVPPDEPRMEAYSHGGYLLFLVDSVWTIAVLTLILGSGLGTRIRSAVERLARSANLQVALYAALFTLLTFVAAFPLTIYRGFVREKQYGFANQTFGSWLGDQGKALLVEVVLQVVLFTVLYVAIRRLGRGWWIAGAAIAIAFLILVLAVGPVFIAPLFNKFEPLKDAELRAAILSMARAQGIPADEVYQVDASRQSAHNNAYVAGLLGTQRIVLYDTILKVFTPREIRFVMAHEMGHYVLHHIWRFVAFLSLVSLAGFCIVDRLSRRMIERRSSLGIRSLADPASIPLVVLVLSVFLFLTGPAVSAFSRVQERQADHFGLELTGDPVATASVFVKFGRHDLGEYEVHPLIETLLFDHPSLGSRIRYAQEYARAHGEGQGAPTAGGAER